MHIDCPGTEGFALLKNTRKGQDMYKNWFLLPDICSKINEESMKKAEGIK